MKDYKPLAEQMVSHHGVESNQASDECLTEYVDSQRHGEVGDLTNQSEQLHYFEVEDAITYGIEAALLLAYMRLRLTDAPLSGYSSNGGYHWFCLSISGWQAIYPYLGRKKIKNVLESLEQQGKILAKALNRKGWDRSKWYTIPSEYHNESPTRELRPKRYFSVSDAKEFGVDMALIINLIDWWLDPDSSDNTRVEHGVRWVCTAYKKLAKALPFIPERRVQKRVAELRKQGRYLTIKLDGKRYDNRHWVASVSSVVSFIKDNTSNEIDVEVLKTWLEQREYAADDAYSKVEKSPLATRLRVKSKPRAKNLPKDEYPNSIKADAILSKLKRQGHNVYDGPLTAGEWDLIERNSELVIDNLEVYITGFINNVPYRKAVSLPDMFDIDFNGINCFEDYLTKVAYLWVD